MATPTSTKKGNLLIFHISALIVVGIWGASFVWTGFLKNDEGLSAVEIYIYRFLIAYLLIWPFAGRKLWANSAFDELLLALCGICGGSIYFIAENNAVGYTTASNVSLLTTLAPLITALLIGILYKDERPGLWVWVGSVVAFLGVALIVFKDGFNFHVGSIGDILAILASFSWALYSLVLRKVDANYSALFITRKTFFYGLVTALPFLAFEPSITPLSELMKPQVIGYILILALCASLAGYFVWSLAVQKLGAIKASNYLYFQPVATMIISAIWGHNDPITLVGCLGCVLIVGGVWMGDTLSAKKKLK